MLNLSTEKWDAQFRQADQCYRAGDLARTEAICGQILAAAPRHLHALHLMGVVLAQTGRLAQAIANLRQVVERSPESVGARNDLGTAYMDSRRFPEAAAAYREAIALQPRSPKEYFFLGNALHGCGRLDEAIAAYRQTLALDPSHFEAWNLLGQLLGESGHSDEALRVFRDIIAKDPCNFEAHRNLSAALKDAGCLTEAIAEIRVAMNLRPEDAACHSALLFLLQHHADYDGLMLLDESRRWHSRHAAGFTPKAVSHAHEPMAQRRLRIGYVSSDFYFSAAGGFILPLLQAHDHQAHEIFCFSGAPRSDFLTEQCRAVADGWHDIFRASDEAVAEIIRREKIDILVDLNLHTPGHRLQLFARKLAPAQVTYLAYCGTTGLDAMDYRLTDPYLDPAGTDANYSEKSVRLPETFWCYDPGVPTPSVNNVPAAHAGHVTFGCLNNFCKVSDAVLAAWGKLLAALPNSRLILHSVAGTHRQRVLNALGAMQVNPERIEFVGRVAVGEYFATYQRIDIALDPFPYGGGTTTCDALWMGVPVITLAGRTGVGRGGVSILSNIGCALWVADTVDEYVAKALQLAGDPTHLGHVRATLRQRMQDSPLMDTKRFARHVEAAYRSMWQRWCETRDVVTQ